MAPVVNAKYIFANPIEAGGPGEYARLPFFCFASLTRFQVFPSQGRP